MIKIELRKDGWFEAGKDCKVSFPFAYRCYIGKQELKKSLNEIGSAYSAGELEKKLSEFEKLDRMSGDFKGTPYLQGSDIMIDTHGMPGQCYLGRIVEK